MPNSAQQSKIAVFFRRAQNAPRYFIKRGFYYFKISLHFIPDQFEVLSGKRNPLVPPTWRVFTGSGDYLESGRVFLGYFKELGGLQPHHQVLEVGSGLGRMALPLLSYLDQCGSYQGIEIVKSAVRWCRKITRKRACFRFVHADSYNSAYNSQGKSLAKDYQFPFADESFDFLFMTSVVTHMLPQETRHYLKDWYEEAGLTLQDPIHFGNWCGREVHLSYQDIVVAKK